MSLAPGARLGAYEITALIYVRPQRDVSPSSAYEVKKVKMDFFEET
jgi:hypothetical protein